MNHLWEAIERGELNRREGGRLRAWVPPGFRGGAGRSIALAFYADEGFDGRILGLTHTEWTEIAGPSKQPYLGEPPVALRLDLEAAAELMDSLWAAGIRPREIGNAGQLAAVERHLEDMRALIFAKLDVVPPNGRSR
jgi:hypothetical protein